MQDFRREFGLPQPWNAERMYLLWGGLASLVAFQLAELSRAPPRLENKKMLVPKCGRLRSGVVKVHDVSLREPQFLMDKGEAVFHTEHVFF